MATLEYVLVKNNTITKCPFGMSVNVGSLGCKECKYFGMKSDAVSRVVCNYDKEHPEAAQRELKWRKCKAGYKFPSEAIVIPQDSRTNDTDPRLVKCAVWDSKYILIDDLKKLPEE